MVSLFIMFCGFLFAIYFVLDKTRKEVSKLPNDIKKELKESFPAIEQLRHYPGDDGLKKVAYKLSNVKKVYNTRIITPDYKGNLYNDETDIWNENIIKQVMEGLTFVDIVCGKGMKSAETITNELNKKPGMVKGKYTSIKIDFSWKSFINFKILEFSDGTHELWFGWRISQTTAIDEICFRSTDPLIIKLFEELHKDLQRSGTVWKRFPVDTDD